MATDRKEHSDRVRKHIEKAIDQAEAERKRKMQQRRIELVRQGTSAYHAGRMSEAVYCFELYLTVLEDLKEAGPGQLKPSMFDHKKEMSELLLVNGIYWDLVKLFDRAKTEEKKKLFRKYMEKYILFSKGMPFQPLCAESMRKYIITDKAVHKNDFKSAYKMIQTTKCFIATSLVDVLEPDTMPRLRDFRDGPLSATLAGRAMIQVYYVLAPACAAVLDRCPQALRDRAGHLLDCLALRLGS